MIKRSSGFFKRLLTMICIILVFVMGLSASVLAEPTDSFTHEDTYNVDPISVMSREMYVSTEFINASSLGLEESFIGISDLCTDNQDNVYFLIGDNSRIVVLDSNYTYKTTITLVKDGEAIRFDGAQGIYIDDKDNLYVCDTLNSRIIVSDMSGSIKEYMEAPDSDLLPDDFFYQPYRMAIDKKGYMYIISLGCYYGALSYSPDREFLGFYGANNVNSTALDTLSFLWNKLMQTDAKKAATAKVLPYSFVDLALDSEGYMLTCTGKTDDASNGTGQIRKLSPSGSDILYKRDTTGNSTSSASVNFLESKPVKRSQRTLVQNIIAVDTDKDNFIYALDQAYGLIYVYDSECNMLCGFGGGSSGSRQRGIFDQATSLLVHNDNILVADSKSGMVTVFALTGYGEALKRAQTAYILGDYEDSKELWHEVLSYNRNSQLAYRGLAMAAIVDKDYEKALEYAEIGYDYTVYDMAFKELISKRISSGFVIYFPISIVLIAALVTFLVIRKKKGIVLIKNQKVKLALSSVIHPYSSFEEIKYKNMGSVVIALVIIALLFFADMFRKTSSGFLAMEGTAETYNVAYTLLGTVGVLALWVVSNWLISCLFDGKGTFKDVLVATTYALIPYVIFIYIRVILSHFLTLSGLSILNGFGIAVVIFTAYLLMIALMAMHEYDFFKFLLTSIVSVLFMILIVFVIFLAGVLWQQIGKFISAVFTELVYR
ncbi:MAG: YIP1 family protein [Clostridia bacterium]|nr:YIP1 family protein [Clostridia bacterium]